MAAERRSAPDLARSPTLTGALLRAGLLAVAVALAFVLLKWGPLADLATREGMTGLLQDAARSRWAAPLLIALWAIFSPLGLPASPLLFAGGAVFGPFWGWALNFTGAFLGAVASFAVARVFGRDLIVHLFGAQRIDRVEQVLERHGFWTLVGVRFVPVPFPLVNYGAALAGMRLPAFMASAVLGLVVPVGIFTYLSYAVVAGVTGGRQTALWTLAVLLVIGLTIILLPGARRLRREWRAGPEEES